MANFKLIYPSICSCGRELGVLQTDFEQYEVAPNNIPQKLNEFKITKMCCRRSIICAPVSIITSADIETYRDEVNVGNKFRPADTSTAVNMPIVSNAPEPMHDPFPTLPGEISEVVVIQPPKLPTVVLPGLFLI